MKILDTIALTLVIIGAVNWGLIGFFNFNLVTWIFGADLAIVSRMIFDIVGLASLAGITFLFKDERRA